MIEKIGCFFLKPGPGDTPIQCFIRRERATSTFRLFMGLSPGNFSIFLGENVCSDSC